VSGGTQYSEITDILHYVVLIYHCNLLKNEVMQWWQIITVTINAVIVIATKESY